MNGWRKPQKWIDVRDLGKGAEVAVRWPDSINPATGKHRISWKRGWLESVSFSEHGGPRSATVVFTRGDGITGRIDIHRLADIGIPDTKDHHQRRLG